MENLTIREVETLLDAVRAFGPDQQALKAVEELGELVQALCKFRVEAANGNASALWDNIAEEMADVYIPLEQLKIIYANHSRVEAWAHEKLARLRARIDQRREAPAR